MSEQVTKVLGRLRAKCYDERVGHTSKFTFGPEDCISPNARPGTTWAAPISTAIATFQGEMPEADGWQVACNVVEGADAIYNITVIWPKHTASTQGRSEVRQRPARAKAAS